MGRLGSGKCTHLRTQCLSLSGVHRRDRGLGVQDQRRGVGGQGPNTQSGSITDRVALGRRRAYWRIGDHTQDVWTSRVVVASDAHGVEERARAGARTDDRVDDLGPVIAVGRQGSHVTAGQALRYVLQHLRRQRAGLVGADVLQRQAAHVAIERPNSARRKAADCAARKAADSTSGETADGAAGQRLRCVRVRDEDRQVKVTRQARQANRQLCSSRRVRWQRNRVFVLLARAGEVGEVQCARFERRLSGAPRVEDSDRSNSVRNRARVVHRFAVVRDLHSRGAANGLPVDRAQCYGRVSWTEK